jgi:membrane fusion protein, multidrug efflux system
MSGLQFCRQSLKKQAAMRSVSIIFPILAILSACGGEEKRDRPPPLVTTQAVVQRTFVDRYQAVGTAIANEQVILTAPVTERITRLGFNDGDYVRAGQMVAILAQGQESSALASANAQAREAEQQLARIAALRDKGFATKASLDMQIAALAAARGQAGEARASIADRVVRAPFSGYASLRNISVGAVVSAGSEIATVSDTSRIKLDFAVPETLLSSVAVGQPIEARSSAYPDFPLRGTVSAVDPVVDPVTRSATLRAILPNGDGRIKPGMLLSVQIESRARSGVAVPELAVLLEGEQRYVYTIDEDGKAKRIQVETGGREGNLVEIVKGLAPGTKVVTEGVVKLSEGVKVRMAGNDAYGQRKREP